MSTNIRRNIPVAEIDGHRLLRMDDFPCEFSHNAADSPESQLIGGPIQQHPDRCELANPITHVRADAPPFFIMHGTVDPLVPFDQSQRLFDALKKAIPPHKVQPVLIPIRGAGHGGKEFENAEVSARAVESR